jgi:hypothetical protein
MKSLTINEVKKRILKAPNGEEHSLNDCLYFGVSGQPYVEKSVAEAAGLTETIPNPNPLYVYLTAGHLPVLLKHLLETDGYLVEG